MYLSKDAIALILAGNLLGIVCAAVALVALYLAYRTICSRHEKAMQELRDLSDDIAHDLRTPLTRMRSQAELAAMGSVPAQELAAGVAEESTAMLELINTMLDLSQTGARIERSPREDVDFAAVVRQMSELYATIAEDKNLTLAVDLPPGEMKLSAHKAKLQQLVGNLLDNAVKFTPSGGKVSVALARSHDHIQFTVSDTGPGISPTDLPNVFKRFWRSDESRSLPGNGLGLALVKAIATSYGGEVSCASELGKGTTFTVRL